MKRLPDHLMARDLVGMTCITLMLGALCVAFAFYLGAPLVLPEGESPALGVDPSLPMLATVIFYVLLRIAKRYSGNPGDPKTERGEIIDDLYLLALFGLVSMLHFHFKMWVPLLNEANFDAEFYAVDLRFGVLIDGMKTLRSGLAGLMPYPDRWYDVVYFSIFPLAYCSHALGDRRWLYPMIIAITLIHAWGALLYLIAPAAGPFIFEQGENLRATLAQQEMYSQSLLMREGGVSFLDEHASTFFTAPVAAMPSLHVAASITLAYYAVRGRILIAPLAVFVAFWMAIEAVVSRWHYLVDLPAGVLIAVIVIGFTNRLCHFRIADAPGQGKHERDPDEKDWLASAVRSS